MNPHLDFLLSPAYDGPTRLDHVPHLEDLRKSGLTDVTIAAQKFSDVPPHMIDQLLEFPAPQVRSAYVLPFPDPAGGFMGHVRMKVFPAFKDRRGQTVKYLQPRGSGVRLYFDIATMDRALHGDEPLWLLEGEKKALAVAQLGLPAIGFCGIEGWHTKGSRALIPDFDDVGLAGRIVKLVPDGDWQTNPRVERAARAFAEALELRAARVHLVILPPADEGAHG